jgi:hypothetical protein
MLRKSKRIKELEASVEGLISLVSDLMVKIDELENEKPILRSPKRIISLESPDGRDSSTFN